MAARWRVPAVLLLVTAPTVLTACGQSSTLAARTPRAEVAIDTSMPRGEVAAALVRTEAAGTADFTDVQSYTGASSSVSAYHASGLLRFAGPVIDQTVQVQEPNGRRGSPLHDLLFGRTVYVQSTNGWVEGRYPEVPPVFGPLQTQTLTDPRTRVVKIGRVGFEGRRAVE